MTTTLADPITQLHKAYEEAVRGLYSSSVHLIQTAWDFGDALSQKREGLKEAQFRLYCEALGIHATDATACLKVRALGAKAELASGNQMRQAMLLVGLPAKEHGEQGQGEVREFVARPAHYAALLNDWSRYKRMIDSGVTQLDCTAKEELRPLFEWLRAVLD